MCKYVFVIALPVAHSRDYRKSHRVVACTYVFTLYASTVGCVCVCVCASKGVQVAYGVGAGCGNENAGNANSAHMYNARKELSYQCSIMQKLLIIMRI